MNLHKFIRRICAAAVAAALTLSLCTPVLAEGTAALPTAETGGIPIDPAHFPDEHFIAYVELYCDKDDDGTLSQDELNGVTALIIDHAYIKDLTGIELFQNLEKLDCKNNNLTCLDVSKNTQLTVLYCESNHLTSLDLSKNIELTELNCQDNQLTSLDLSKNTALTKLDCALNPLTSLDVSNNPALTYLNCNYNHLTSLDLSKNTQLTALGCSGNQLTRLDLSENTALDTLDCSGNKRQITVGETGQFNLSALKGFDVSKASGWSEGAAVDGNILTVPYGVTEISYQYDLGNGKSGTFTLTFDEVKDPNAVPITAAHFPDAKFLEYVKQFDTDGNGSLSQAELEKVTVIYVLGMGVKDLTGIEFFPELENLDCSENQLTQLDVSKNPKLKRLVCYENKLTSLDVSGNTSLTELHCYTNQLTSLNLGENANLDMLNCVVNRLTSLDLSGNANLTRLSCSSNLLTSLDVSNNPNLILLDCERNLLTSLNVSKNTELDTLDCSGNKRQITVGETGQFDLSQLDGFDVSKASGWSEGATVDGNILTVPYGVTEISYQYDLGNGKSGTFTLTFDEVKEPDLPDDSSAPADTGSTAGGAIAAVAVGGAAVWGGYELVTRVMLHSLLPEGAAIPASRGQLALLVWNTAGRPEPVNAPAFADVTDPDTARATQWCVEQGLLTLKKDGSFDPDGWTSKFRVIQVWNKAFPKQ